VAAVLLLIDHLSAGPSPSVILAAIAAFGAIGLIANLGSLIVALSTDVTGVAGTAQVWQGRVALVLSYLAPAALAGLTCWIGVIGGGMVGATHLDDL
jgi:hypothetical protein